MWRIVLFVALAVGLAMRPWTTEIPVAASTTGTLSVGTITGVVGEVTPIDINVSGMNDPGLGAWTVDITYDPTKLQPTGVTGATRGCIGYFGGVCSMHYASNKGRFTGASATGLLGDFTLGTAFFSCPSPGTSPLILSTNVFADATPGNPQPIITDVHNGSITCVAPSPTPTATTTPTAVLTDRDFFGPTTTPTSVALPSTGGGGAEHAPALWLPLALLGAAGALGLAAAWRRMRA